MGFRSKKAPSHKRMAKVIKWWQGWGCTPHLECSDKGPVGGVYCMWATGGYHKSWCEDPRNNPVAAMEFLAWMRIKHHISADFTIKNSKTYEAEWTVFLLHMVEPPGHRFIEFPLAGDDFCIAVCNIAETVLNYLENEDVDIF